MIKSLLTSVALVATVLTANAQNYQLSLADIGSGWGSSYDATTKTITFDSAWTGRGWWLKGETPLDASNYSEVVIDFEPVDYSVKVVVEYNYLTEDGKYYSSDNTAEGSTGTVSCTLDPDYKDKVVQIFIQNGAAGTLTLKDAYLKDASNTTLYSLWEGSCDFGTDWNSSFSIPASDLALLPNDDATLVFSYTTGSASYSQIKLCSNASGWKSLNISKELGNSYDCISLSQSSTSISLTLKTEDIATIKADGLRVQGYNATISEVELAVEGEPIVVDPNLLWEGEYVGSGWNIGAEFSTSTLKEGDILEFTFSEEGNNSSIILKSNYKNLLGTENISSVDIATGSAQIGVTAEMLAAAGDRLFLQADGGVTVTKIYRIEGGFDADNNLIVWGERILKTGVGTSAYFDVPETKYINLTLSKVPEYLQIQSDVATIADPVNRIYKKGDASVTYQYEVNDAWVTALTALDKWENRVGVNIASNDTELLSLSVADELVLDYDADKVKRVETIEDVILTYSEPITVAYEEMPGFGKGSELVITYTRGTSENLSIDVYALVDGTPEVQITVYYPPYGTGDVVIPLTEEQATAIRNGGLYIEGNGVVVNKILYTEGEEISGIADVTVDADAPVEYYNLQGIKISADDATNGIFIRRQGGKSMKVAR